MRNITLIAAFKSLAIREIFASDSYKEHEDKNQLRRIYIHYFYNIDKATEDEKAFDRKLIALRQELESDRRVPEHESLYKKYFVNRRFFPFALHVIMHIIIHKDGKGKQKKA